MKRNKGKKKVKREQGNKNGPRMSYEDIVRENKDFETYYKLQKICPEDEWDRFIQKMKEDLPTAFRITSSKSEAKAFLKIVEGQYFKDFLNAREGDDMREPVPLPWYPEKLAWQVQLTRKDIRRCEAFFKLHNFLISETDSGNISRQEVVSMIPPIALQVESHHKILDMCASPGSKTAQLIESLHKDERVPKGFVIANDIDNNRCYMLVHQAKRLNRGNKDILKFDRILCDVPCTGDGTLRKNSDIWTKWNTANGNNLHGVQFRIIKRGTEMLDIGGRLVYSTCSLNPLENEAVIARLLTEAKGSLRLVNLAPHFPGLKYSKGLKSWLVTSRDLQGYKTFADVPQQWHTVVRPQMFPPSPEIAEQLNLDYCIRILPHHQDTGGFFIAAVEKTDLLPWESSKNEDNNLKSEAKEPPKKKKRIFGYREDPFIFFDKDEPVWADIKEFYNITNELPEHCLLTRCKVGKKKNIYITSPEVREIVMNNAEKIKIINTGVKVFARCDTKGMKCAFRLAQEGLRSIFPYIGPKRKVSITKDDLLQLLNNGDPKNPLETKKLEPETQKALSSIGKLYSGSCVLVYDEEPVTDTSLHVELVGWVGAVSTRLYIPENDSIHYLRLLGGDTSKFGKPLLASVEHALLFQCTEPHILSDVNKFKKPENKTEVKMDSENQEVKLEAADDSM
ncbi:hypothetical protein RUM43_002879 [Polyplax serrata]|uniref:tRNA (cytosine(34)-C(5))-methyltransferase n=1 Tax=Polyplax serrata TaxID=468196 RepID=A0AAN8S567_POLSC